MKARSLALSLLTFVSVNAYAEHEATYCGVPQNAARAKDTYGNTLEAVIAVDFQVAVGDPWEDRYGTVRAYAGMHSLTAKQAQIIEQALEDEKVVCVSASWGGGMSESRKITSIDLTTDAIAQLNTEEKFNFKKIGDESVYGL